MLWSLALFGFVLASAQGRAVNISNTWVLPEEGFPVFYRYFRDRISWYEADAVCQFHHANLVTVDTTAQYDAVRAYLKELDISSAVWVGLIRSNPDGDFTWTDYRGLSRDGYWSAAPDPRAAPLCAAADPAADYRWEARACGGPTVASFICELPVPQWALGNEGCMVRALPALTVLYLPESAAVQLTADCGLAGVKRVQCTGNVQREELLRGLSCAEDDMQSSTLSAIATSASSSPVSSDTPFTDQDLISEITTEENTTTEHEDDINQSSTIIPTIAPIAPSMRPEVTAMQNIKNLNKVFINKNIDLSYNFNNNLQSNVIPKIAGNDNYLTSDLSEKLEDEKHMQHKMLHDEIARHGNIETIFTQPTDHFVPPLVMAKAKISDDMTVLSLEEKHAQQLAEQRYMKHYHDDNLDLENKLLTSPTDKDESQKADLADKPLITTTSPRFSKDNIKKDVVKTITPKKFTDKQYGLKSKTFKVIENKSFKPEKTTESFSTATERASTELETTTPKNINYTPHISTFEDQPTLDLTVIIKESNSEQNKNKEFNNSEIPKVKIVQNDISFTDPIIKLSNQHNTNGEVTQEISVKLPATSVNNFTLAHEIIKITILKEENTSETLTAFDVTTKTPIFDDNTFETTTVPLFQDSANETMKNNSAASDFATTKLILETITESTVTSLANEFTSGATEPLATQKEIHEMKTTHSEEILTATASTPVTTLINDITTDFTNTTNQLISDNNDSKTNPHIEADDIEGNATDTSEPIDDLNSPLLSGANEPLHKPNRSRRPQPANRINKFNPFRILG